MYETKTEGISADEAKIAYRDFLSNLPGFRSAMERVAREWPISCEHFLLSQDINRIAWLGQSAMCITTGISRAFRSGFMLLTGEQQRAANLEAEQFLNEWIDNYKRSHQ